jgi:hypothetical protein
VTTTELLGLAICIAALIALRVSREPDDGMPTRRQRRQWERERLVQPKWNRR